jgi:enediyne biosynthesis protein E4
MISKPTTLPVNSKITTSIIIAALIISCSKLFGQAMFTDVTTAADIDHQYKVYEGTFGGGACILDFDNDGWEDIYLAGGMGKDLLLRNNRNGTFSDVYDVSGLTESSSFVTQGAASADVNKDGLVDILITTITSKTEKKEIPRAPNLLFINNGDATFRNATTDYGLSDLLSFSQGACFGDINADGYPDLFIGNYFQEYSGKLNIMNDAMIVGSNQMSRGYLLMNEDGKYFSDEYNEYGLKHKGFGFGGAFTDFDNDGDLDILINHDFGYKSTPNLLMSNQYPDESFVDVGKEKDMDRKMNAMGVAVGDYNNDGLMDYYLTNIRANHFMVNQGHNKPFVNRAKELGTAYNFIGDKKGRYLAIGWGANFGDFDNDTDLDLFVSNGCLNPNVAPVPDFYFENNNGVFSQKSEEAGISNYGIGRGSVVFDYDNDGDLDLLVVNQQQVNSVVEFESVTKLYRNDSKKGNWTKVSLKGFYSDTKGIGSRVEVVVDSIKMIREIDGGSGYISQTSTIAHFGLADAKIIDSIIVKWIGGEKQILLNQPANKLIQITQEPKHSSQSMLFTIAIVFALAIAIYFGIRIYRKSLATRSYDRPGIS